jgi:hypothetical protein
MIEAPTTATLAEAADISKSYASEILTRVREGGEKGRKPSRPLAIHILRTTGWRHPILADLSDEQIDTLEAIEPWVAPADRPAEQAQAA